MKNRILTNALRNVKKSFPRFISLFIMSMLGVFVYSGLQATSPDMLKTLDNYLDKYDTYDLKVVSTLGLTDSDILEIEKISGVEEVMGSFSTDVLSYIDESEYVINISSIPTNINKLELLSGNYPSNSLEIVVEENLLSDNNLSLGDKIVLDGYSNTYTIVGTVDSSLYFNCTDTSQTRGETKLGSGSINYYAYTLDDFFDIDYYNYIYITVSNAKELTTSSDEYNDKINEVIDNINEIKDSREEERYLEIYNSLKEEIEQEEEKVLSELSEQEEDLNDIKDELNKAKIELDKVKEELATSKSNLSTAKSTLNSAKKEYNNTLNKYNIKESEIESNINTLEDDIKNINNILVNLDSSSSEYLNYSNTLDELESSLELLNTLMSTKNEITKQENSYNYNLKKYNQAYNSYQTNLNTYNSNLLEYNNKLDEFNKAKEEALEKIEEAYLELDEIEMANWYIYDRLDYNTYSEYIDDSQSINNLSKIFPLVFFLVAILISLISMNRMVEDDRLEIGTLKSLGFSNNYILFKYLLFSGLATILGGLLGAFLGIIILPKLIFSIYTILFDLPELILDLNLSSTLLGFIISLICICGTTIYTVLVVVKEKPATLMRPKAPKSGKRIILEKIKFIWNNISFSNKVTIRNIFRYKKRVFVTIFGVMGCTALMLCGFGIKDAISDIPSLQYGHIFTFDGTAIVNNLDDYTIFDNDDITDIVKVENISGSVNDTNSYLFVAEDSDALKKIINFEDSKTEEKVYLSSGKAIITVKLANEENLKVGDFVTFTDIDNNTYQYEVSSIVNMYVDHYIFIDSSTFEDDNNTFNPNVIYFNTTDLENKDNLSSTLLENDNVLTVSYISDLVERVSNMLKSLDKVVLILIVLSSLLSFVVMYNLSNINISERRREVATLKVLGFYDHEVDNYITKENIILTIIGIIFGLIIGYFLTNIVVSTIEIERAYFIKEIKIQSYIYASIISLLFTLIVNLVMHFILKKIDMVESLKSVE